MFRVALLGNPNKSILLNHLFVIIKRYIHHYKYINMTLDLDEVINRIKFSKNIEIKTISHKNGGFKNYNNNNYY